jgi:hypothetical protein
LIRFCCFSTQTDTRRPRYLYAGKSANFGDQENRYQANDARQGIDHEIAHTRMSAGYQQLNHFHRTGEDYENRRE